MRRAAKIGLGVAGAAGTWLGALAIAGVAARGCVTERIRGRLADSLDATVSIRDLDVGLVRGTFALDGLVIDRVHDGHLHVAVDRIDAGIAPLGAYLWDRALGAVRVAGVDFEVTGWGVLRIRPPRRPPLALGTLAIDDARFRLDAASWGPAWASIGLTIDHAEAGATVLRTPLSWVFALERLDAELELPGSAPVTLHYAGGRLAASGGIFGDTPVSIAVTLPTPEPGHEGAQLVSLGADVAERLALARASGWLFEQLGP